MEDQQAMESTITVFEDVKKHFEASSSTGTGLHWTSIDDVAPFEDKNVRVLPGKKALQFISDQIEFQEKIGKGGQGTIHKVNVLFKNPNTQELTPDWHCAVKTFKGNLLDNHFGQWPEELFDTHSDCHYICKFYGYFAHKDSFCLIMENYDCSLHACIQKHMKKGFFKRRPFHGPVAMGIIIQLAIGMAFLHLLNILHRDLKADNIFVMNISEEDDTPAAIFIGDFDISPTVVGTAFWRAPEILQGLKDLKQFRDSGTVDTSVYWDMLRALPFTKKSDVYSFAMTCYEILTGRIPFEGIGVYNYDVVLSGERPTLPSDVNPKMKELLNKCWHHDPDVRPSFTDIVLELKGFVEGTEAYIPIFKSFEFETHRLRNRSDESNFLELKELVHVMAKKYNQEDFVVWTAQFGDAIEQFKIQFGLQSFTEHPVLPPLKGLSRLILLETIQFKWQMFFATCPFYIPECMPFCRLMQVVFIEKIQKGSTGETIGPLVDPKEAVGWRSMFSAWEEEKQRRLPIPKNRHDVCYDVLTGKHDVGRNRDEACDICKPLPFYAPKSTVSTFSLYSKDNYTSLKSMFTWFWHIMKKLFYIGR